MRRVDKFRLERAVRTGKGVAVKTLDQQPGNLPKLKLNHLWRMTDSTGMFQHATYSVPNFAEGYCTDDNARALILTVLLEELGYDGLELQRIATTTAALPQAAFHRRRSRLRNFLSIHPRLL